MNINLKKLLSTLIALVALSMTQCALANDIFASLSGRPQVESTYVSGRFAHNMRTWRSRDYNHSMSLEKGFSALYSYQCYSEQDVTDARKILDDYIKKNPDVELMMQTKQASGEYSIYEKFNSDDLVTQMVIWNATSPSNCEMVVIDFKNGIKPSTPK